MSPAALLAGLVAYGAVGVLTALAFVTFGVVRVLPHPVPVTIGARILLIPARREARLASGPPRRSRRAGAGWPRSRTPAGVAGCGERIVGAGYLAR